MKRHTGGSREQQLLQCAGVQNQGGIPCAPTRLCAQALHSSSCNVVTGALLVLKASLAEKRRHFWQRQQREDLLSEMRGPCSLHGFTPYSFSLPPQHKAEEPHPGL